MTESPKSMLCWFAGLLTRLVLIALACFVLITVVAFALALLLVPIFADDHRLLAFTFPALVFLAGYTWTFYHHFPFSLSHAKRRRKLIAAIIALPLTAVSCLAIYVSVRVADPFESESGAEFISPADPANKILFTDGGFLDRDLELYAKPKGKKEQFVGSLYFTGEYGLAYAQWTKDGQAVVCSLQGKRVGNAPVMEIVYDFSTAKVISWGDEATILKIVAAHGGLNSQHIDDDMIRKHEKTLCFWQIPKR